MNIQHELLIEEQQVNNLLDSGISKIKNIINARDYQPNSSYYYNHPILNKEIQLSSYSSIPDHEGAKIEKLSYKNNELSDYLFEVKKKNDELLRLIQLQKNDFKDMDGKYNSLSQDYHQLFDRFRHSEQIRAEQINLIQLIQKELDTIRLGAIGNKSQQDSNNINKDNDNDSEYKIKSTAKNNTKLKSSNSLSKSTTKTKSTNTLSKIKPKSTSSTSKLKINKKSK